MDGRLLISIIVWWDVQRFVGWLKPSPIIVVTASSTNNPWSISQAGVKFEEEVYSGHLSSGRAFRKVQLIVPNSVGGKIVGAGASTFGVAGQDATDAPTADYLTGYIELGWEGQNQGAPVARSP